MTAETVAPAADINENASQAAVIVACGGTGTRFYGSAGSEGDKDGFSEKQFFLLAGKPVLAYTLDVLEKHPRVALVVLVLPRPLLDTGEALIKGIWPPGIALPYAKVKRVLAGGEDRQQSVANGIAALADLGWTGPVLVQDGVRPCTPGEVYDRVIDGVLTYGNAVAAIPLRDTVKRMDSQGIVQETIDRQGLWQIQTPQGFWMHELAEAYEEGRRKGRKVTDDAALVEALGHQVYLVKGDPANIKLTYREDVALLEALLSGF